MLNWIVGRIRDHRSYAIMAGQLSKLNDEMLLDIGLDRPCPFSGCDAADLTSSVLDMEVQTHQAMARYIRATRHLRALASIVRFPVARQGEWK